VLTNLKNAHVARGDLARALVAATRIATLMPGEGWAIRDRGLLQAQLGAHGGARDDLLRYLELAPTAADVTRVRELLGRLSREKRAAN
jgi:regulator of sirC expression with transglutaminase-like and TPR domain